MIDPNTGLETVEEPKKVTFSEEQQALVNTLIQKKQGEAAKEVRTQLAAEREEKDRIASELAAAKAALAAAGTKKEKSAAQDDIDALKAEMDEIRRTAAATKAEAERWQQVASAKEKEVRDANNKVIDTQKKIAIQQAAGKQPFFDINSVVKLTEDSIKWDDTKQRFVVIGEGGAERMNSSFEPLSLEDYYAEFASKTPFMVRGDVRGGTGSTESQRSSLMGPGQLDVKTVFGKGSNAALANKLAMENPKEYQRLKAVAKSQGILS